VQQRPLPYLPDRPDLPDLHLEEDIQRAEEMFNSERNDIPLPPPPPLRPQHATVGDVSEKEEVIDDHRYIEKFPEEYLAGATWGNCKPFYEYLDEELRTEGGSRWGPFEDEDEWRLAEWLIRNVGQKQTDVFLKLPIVSFFLFSILGNVLTNDRLKTVHNPPIGVTRAC
jgi:hypothetical protein